MIGLFIKVLDFALPVLAMIFVGLVGTSVLVELGLMQKFSRLVKALSLPTLTCPIPALQLSWCQ